MDRERTYTVTARHEGKRLDNVLRELMPDVSLGRINKLVRKGRVRVNDKKTRHQQRVATGDVITFNEAPMEDAWTKTGRTRAMRSKAAFVDAIDFEVLYEDEHMLAVSKPAGLLVQESKREPNAPTLSAQVIAYCAQRQIEETDNEDDERSLSEFVRPTPRFQPSLAHRIDRWTSGVLLVAKTIECLQELTRMIKKRQLDKRYIGLVKGGLAGGKGEINAPISRRDQAGKLTGRQSVDVGSKHAAAKNALTRYVTLGQSGTYSLVEFELVTGRTHQIRAHLKHVGSALIGDDEYGDRALNRVAKNSLGIERQALHAAKITLKHPITQEPLEIVAPVPDDIAKALETSGIGLAALPDYLQQEFESDVRDVGTSVTEE